jgi:hypothetical protein
MTKPKKIDSNGRNAVPDSSSPELGIEGTEATQVQAFGIKNRNSMLVLMRQILGITLDYGYPTGSQSLDGAVATLNSIAPRDALEGLLAVQMIGVHNLAMESLSRAVVAKDPGVTNTCMNRAVKLLRTFTAQMEALNRHRGKIGQPMVAGNVNVNDGVQAIVGTVNKPI